MGYSKSDPRHPMNSEKTTGDPAGLKPKKKKTPPSVAMTKTKTQYAYGGKKMKMASYYSKGGTVFTGR
jgi:hypothetical protein